MDGRFIEHQLDDLRLLGYSLAGEETVVAAPELNVCFDVGKAPSEMLAIDHVLLSHGHMDHAAGIAYYLSQRNFVGNAPGTIVLPTPLVQPVKDLLHVWARIEGHLTPANIVGLEPDQTHTIRRGLVARAFDVNHGVPALGFVIMDIRHKLRPEFEGLAGPEIVALKKKGVEIEYTKEVPLVAYCGDTAEGKWLDREDVRNAKTLIVECTFFEPDQVRRARAGYHLHVRDLARMIGKMKNDHIVVSHVTRRTSLRDAKRILSKMISESDASRVRFLMDGRRYRPHHHRAQQPGDGNDQSRDSGNPRQVQSEPRP